MTTRNSEVLASFVKYCKAHPEERFWQALRNWVMEHGVNFVLVAKSISFNADDSVKFHELEDTFYWEGKYHAL